MACARNIGLTSLPIVCVNVDGYYENFRQMLDRAYQDELIKLQPHEILHFEQTAEAAVRWLEEQAAQVPPPSAHPRLRRRSSVLGRSSSFMSPPVADWSFTNNNGKSRWENGKLVFEDSTSWNISLWAFTFAAGLAVGVMAASQGNRSNA